MIHCENTDACAFARTDSGSAIAFCSVVIDCSDISRTNVATGAAGAIVTVTLPARPAQVAIRCDVRFSQPLASRSSMTSCEQTIKSLL